jgi:transcriptional regulator with XRE-family HTH domain
MKNFGLPTHSTHYNGLAQLVNSNPLLRRLKRALIDAGRDQIWLAAETGLSISFVRKIYCGEKKPSRRAALKIESALNRRILSTPSQYRASLPDSLGKKRPNKTKSARLTITARDTWIFSSEPEARAFAEEVGLGRIVERRGCHIRFLKPAEMLLTPSSERSRKAAPSAVIDIWTGGDTPSDSPFPPNERLTPNNA